MKLSKAILIALASASSAFGGALAVTAVQDPAWGRDGDVAAPYTALVFQIGLAAFIVGGLALALVLLRKR
jgi:hypothetical protein